jgi:anti-sigma regulatory factor (Ser/Thr protein kinase)
VTATLDVERWVSADVAELRDVRALVDRVTRGHGIEPRTRYRVKLALHEALTNAILHGCHRRGERVHMRIKVDDDKVTFEVADPGAFREHAERPDPENGRGLALIFGLMDDVDVRVRADGTTIRAATHTH